MKYVMLKKPELKDGDVFDLWDELKGENTPEVRIFSEEHEAFRRQISVLEASGWKRVGTIETDLTPRELKESLMPAADEPAVRPSKVTVPEMSASHRREAARYRKALRAEGRRWDYAEWIDQRMGSQWSPLDVYQ